jgi:hypothetical protein
VPITPPPGFDLSALTSVTSTGDPLAFVSQLPVQLQGIFVQGFHQALTIAIANSMILGVGAAAVSVVVAFFLKEIPLRTSSGAQAAAAKPAPEKAVVGATPALD